MSIEIRKVNIEQKHILKQLIELYSYDLSQYLDTDVNENGFFGYKYLEFYWNEDGRQAYFIVVDEQLAGFLLIHQNLHILKEGKCIAEFFIMKKYRRSGIGKQTVLQIFNNYRGPWEVSMIPENIPSKLFWESVVKEFTQDQFRSKYMNINGIDRLIFTFIS